MYVSYRFVMWCLSVRGGGGKKKDLRVGEVKERYQEKCNKKTHGSHESNPNQDLPSIQDQVRPDRRSDKTATKVSNDQPATRAITFSAFQSKPTINPQIRRKTWRPASPRNDVCLGVFCVDLCLDGAAGSRMLVVVGGQGGSSSRSSRRVCLQARHYPCQTSQLALAHTHTRT